ncbi:UvrD-helicase domain-containing protein [Halalkalibacter okhensis]|uniref:DNA 3'-5' helicase n=1 Tax=Halalkalibacter okhensis TaxID=333138 RepID=A0A0B0I7J7_9BACI|nr:UvrD-helicase domain-containing protein [Halalkalibacter okhensis]KHF38398.1 hypothetical protein LQ50_21620 [Halalkalibacter okhensis]
MQFNDAQLQAITSEKAMILVSAGAGSGKTRVLTERFIHLCELNLKDPTNPVGATVEELVAITFTEKAAREMKDRIRKRLVEKETEAQDEDEKGYWLKQKEAMERANISTFHSFCQRLLSQHAMAADLVPHSRVIDDIEARSRKRMILTKMFEERSFHETAWSLLEMMSKSQLFETIEQIHNDIREFVVGENAVDSLNLEEMLETQKIAKQQEQVNAVHTLHANAKRCIQAFPPVGDLTKAQRGHIEKITEGFDSLPDPDDPNEYMAAMSRIMPSRSDKRWNEKAPTLYELYTEHWKPLKDSWSEVGGNVSTNDDTKDLLSRFFILLKEFSKRYNHEKKIAGVLDFSDLQQKAVALLTNKSIQEACQRQFRHMMIDEFQDTNKLQLEMLEQINPPFQFIVGDQKQSIYRFRGANVSLMNEREELAASSIDGEVILMNENYRTTAPVIEAVNELFSSAMVQKRTEPYETVYAPLRANRPGESAEEKRVELMTLENQEEIEESTYDVLANRIVEMVETKLPKVYNGEQWRNPYFGDIAILIPARSHLLALERSLMDKGIPYVVSGGVGFYERQEILDYTTLLRWLNRPFEELHLLAVLRSPICGLSINDFLLLKQQLEEPEALFELVYDESHLAFEQLPMTIQKACNDVRQWLSKWTPFRTEQSLDKTLHAIFQETGLKTTLMLQKNGLQKVRNVEKLIQTILDSRQSSLELMLDELDDRIELSEKEGESEVERVDGDVVQIMTVHASKGLEFPIVCLPQLERAIKGDKGSIRFHPELGIVMNLEEEATEIDGEKSIYQTPGFPLVKEKATAEAREEAKRLFYVAMTRARDYLFMIGEESNASHTWLALTETAIDTTNLADKILRVDESTNQASLSRQLEPYTIPMLMKNDNIPLTLSVSEIMLFMKDPVAYFNRYVIGMPDTSLVIDNDIETTNTSRGIDSSTLGTLVHRACELRDNGLTNEEAIREAIREEEEQGRDLLLYEREMLGLMKSYTDEIKKDLGESVETEWSFVTMIEDVEIIGEIDKVTTKDGKCHLIDFKTNKIVQSGRELLDLYWPQLYLYKIAYEQEANEVIETMSLFVFRDRETPLHTISVEREADEAVRNSIRTIQNLRFKKATKAEYEALLK